MKAGWFVVWGILATLAWGTAHGQERPAKGGGLSGHLEAGAAYLTSTDQLGTSGENERTGGLSDEADRYDRVLPLVLFELKYTYAESGRAVYLKTPMGDQGPPGIALGGTTPFGEGGELDVSIFAQPFDRVWKDPYREDGEREETSRYTYGLQVDYRHILGSGLGVSYAYSRVRVDDDAIGTRLSVLARDGAIQETRVRYEVSVGRGTSIEPALEYRRGDLAGGANRYHGYGLLLGLRRFSRSYVAMVFLSARWDDYEERHPILGKSREDLSYGAFALFSLPRLFGAEHLFTDLLLGAGRRDSNLAFLDANGFFSGVTLGYRL